MGISYNVSKSWLIRFEKQNELVKDSVSGQLQKVREKMIKNLNITMTQNDCKILQENLNRLITTTGFEKISKELLSQITGGNIEIDLKSTNNIGGLQLANKRWKEYYDYRNQLLKQGESIENNAQLHQYLSSALSLQATLSAIKGQMFESILKAISEVGSTTATSISDINIDQILSHIQNPNFSYKTEGEQRSKMTGTVNLGNGMNYTVNASSQDKVDVNFSFSTPNGEEYKNIGVSAKNYSTLTNIHILSSSPVMSLISQWLGTSISLNKSMLNIMSSRDNPNYSKILDETKKIFAIQALAGQKQQEQKADILIVNTNSGQNPIRVLSISSMLGSIANQSIENSFIFKFQGIVRVPRTPPSVALEETFNQKITVELRKDALKLSYLNQLS